MPRLFGEHNKIQGNGRGTAVTLLCIAEAARERQDQSVRSCNSFRFDSLQRIMRTAAMLYSVPFHVEKTT